VARLENTGPILALQMHVCAKDMRDPLSDLRFAFRAFVKSRVFADVAVLSVALGIGANTTIFTLLQVLLRLLPVKDPQQLVQLRWAGAYYGTNIGYSALSYPMYKDFRDRNQVFSGVICRYALPLRLGLNGRGERLAGEPVSGNYFQVLGVNGVLGRVITPDDDRIPVRHPLAVVSYRFWIERMNGDPAPRSPWLWSQHSRVTSPLSVQRASTLSAPCAVSKPARLANLHLNELGSALQWFVGVSI